MAGLFSLLLGRQCTATITVRRIWPRASAFKLGRLRSRSGTVELHRLGSWSSALQLNRAAGRFQVKRHAGIRTNRRTRAHVRSPPLSPMFSLSKYSPARISTQRRGDSTGSCWRLRRLHIEGRPDRLPRRAVTVPGAFAIPPRSWSRPRIQWRHRRRR